MTQKQIFAVQMVSYVVGCDKETAKRYLEAEEWSVSDACDSWRADNLY